MSLKRLYARFKAELELWRRVWKDPRTPRAAKVLLGAAVAYALTPFDIIPDFIPVLGQLDDVLILPALIWMAVKLTPAHVVAEHRNAVNRARSPESC
jgi:uncharacterized membrane protein YkvA (DUF1232 family)